jgi:uncharacterized protein (TIGR02679 family)
MTACTLCAGACGGADLTLLITDDLAWLWSQVADAADRRGDPTLTTGTLAVRVPDEPAQKAAAVGLITERPLISRRKSIDLPDLTARLQRRSPNLTPGAVAAHHRGTPLAGRAQQSAERLAREAQLQPDIVTLSNAGPLAGRLPPEELRDGLRRTGWLTRILRQDDPARLLQQARQVLAELPETGGRRDRRRIAEAVTGDPHALDDGTALGGLVLAALTCAALMPPAARTRPAWGAVGVDLDDLTGGLLTLGLRPRGWDLPPAAVITLPPRELAQVDWSPPPGPGASVYITENPSVIAAASDLAAEDTSSFVVCTSGTPAAAEIAALASLPELGWRVRVRADFDVAGVDHVRALLAGIPRAEPWRMGAEDYLAHVVAGNGTVPLKGAVGDTPWDPGLAAAMSLHGRAVYEETLLAALLGDLSAR